MSIQFFKSKFQKLSEIKLAEWKKIPPAIAGDVMNRQNVMAGRISPISFGTSMAGQARTVSVISGDNAALHEIITHLRKDEVLVVDAGNYPDRAVWGGILNTRAMKKKIAGVVIDGAARDAADMREMGVPVFVSALSPAGHIRLGWLD